MYTFVPDSLVTHAHDPRFDGRRLGVGCGREHLRRLVEQYEARPFVEAGWE